MTILPGVAAANDLGAAGLAPLAKLAAAMQDFGRAVAGVAGQVLAAVPGFSAASAAVGAVSSALKGLVDAVPGASAAIRGISGAMGGLVGAAAGVTVAAAGIGAAIAGMVGKADPAGMNLFGRALGDLQAVIGGALSPVLAVLTDIVRMAADTLTTFAGTLGGALATVMRSLMPVLTILFEVVGKVGQVFADLVVQAAPILVVFANAVARVVRWVVDGVSELLALIGIDLGGLKTATPGASTGAAVTQSSIGGIDDVLKSAMKSAFSIGGSSADPAKATADAAKLIAERAANIEKFIQELPARMWDYIQKLPQMIADAWKAGAAEVSRAAGFVTTPDSTTGAMAFTAEAVLRAAKYAESLLPDFLK